MCALFCTDGNEDEAYCYCENYDFVDEDNGNLTGLFYFIA